MNDLKKHTLVMIDDHPLFRKGASQLILMEPSLQLIGEASYAEEGIKLVIEQRPDLVLLDLNMKGMGGLEVLEKLKQQDLDARIIILTVSDDDDDVIKALRLGADGYLLKDSEPKEILSSLLKAAQGKLVISENIAECIALALREENKPSTIDQTNLTKRETEILKFIEKGLSNKHIARQLDITESTVKVHVKNLLKKLQMRSRVEAAVWATRQDL